MAQAPFEVIAAPMTIYLAPVGTAFPDVGATPSGSWTLLGTNGSFNYADDGIKVSHEQTIVEFVPVGSTAAVKAFRTAETQKWSLTLVDVSAAHYAKILNNATVTTTSNGGGLAGSLNFELYQDYNVNNFACVLRGSDSAAGNNFNTQYQLPKMYQSANPEPVWKKGDPVGLAIEWTALRDSTLKFGKYVSQNAVVA